MAFQDELAAALDTLPQDALARILAAAEKSDARGERALAEELSDELSRLVDSMPESAIIERLPEAMRDDVKAHLEATLPDRANMSDAIRTRTTLRLLRAWLADRKAKADQEQSSSRQPANALLSVASVSGLACHPRSQRAARSLPRRRLECRGSTRRSDTDLRPIACRKVQSPISRLTIAQRRARRPAARVTTLPMGPASRLGVVGGHEFDLIARISRDGLI
jgi:hypothetical protein